MHLGSKANQIGAVVAGVRLPIVCATTRALIMLRGSGRGGLGEHQRGSGWEWRRQPAYTCKHVVASVHLTTGGTSQVSIGVLVAVVLWYARSKSIWAVRKQLLQSRASEVCLVRGQSTNQ